ncbi:hypothetical protein G6F57_023036 [Rhizopus arrhizus]|nr:hypothetical protein G6F57_023036 [Rhizopus arrhizus]
MGDQVRLPRVHLGKAVHPAGCGAMRRAGVDHPHLRVHDGRRGLAGRLVGQAQDGPVAGVDGFGAALRVLALGLGQRQQAQVGAAVQAFVDLQAGRALVAVDKDKRMGHDVLRPGREGGWWRAPSLAIPAGQVRIIEP